MTMGMMPWPGISAGGSSGDPFWSDVLSLVYFNGTNGSTTITDQVSGVTWAANGSAALSNAALPYASSTTSLHLPGTSGSYVASGKPASYWQPMVLSTGSWTVDVLLRVPSIPGGTQVVFDLGGVATSAFGTYLGVTSAGKLDFAWANSSGSYISRITQGTVVANAFTLASIEFINNGASLGTVYLYQDGILIRSAVLSSASGSTNPSNTLNFGRYAGGNSLFFNGYDGQARFTTASRYGGASFTPPSTYFPNHA